MQTLKRSPMATASPAIEVRRSEIHGRGVFARSALRAGQLIGEYAGKRYAADEVQVVDWNNQLTYLFALSDGSVIDGAQGGNTTRFINHACAPNVEAVERYGAGGELVLRVRALRRIQAGEELFLDYALETDGDDPSDYPCACGHERCRGTMAAPVEER
ncbi:MAG TPA: SET domain-containing protein [Burkholderiaceae bacterium]|nr:SET domain-containing protein [Burkholderiaceae bacterium]